MTSIVGTGDRFDTVVNKFVNKLSGVESAGCGGLGAAVVCGQGIDRHLCRRSETGRCAEGYRTARLA